MGDQALKQKFQNICCSFWDTKNHKFLHEFIYLFRTNCRGTKSLPWKQIFLRAFQAKNISLVLQGYTVIMQGSYFRGVRIFCTAVYCLWADVKAWHGIHLSNKKINEIFWSLETIMWIIKIIWFYPPPRILDEHWCIYSCLQIPPRENWFQYVRRVYATAINFPCIITLDFTKSDLCGKSVKKFMSSDRTHKQTKREIETIHQ